MNPRAIHLQTQGDTVQGMGNAVQEETTRITDVAIEQSGYEIFRIPIAEDVILVQSKL